MHLNMDNRAGNNPVGQGNNLIGNLLNMLNGAISGEELYEGGQSLQQIIQQIVENDPNKYGPPPASKDAISKLPKGNYDFFFPKDEESKIQDDKEDKDKEDSKSCTVCYCDFSQDDESELLQLPCKHLFHEECIMPWFEKHNT